MTKEKSHFKTIFGLALVFQFCHSNDSHQCPILAADFVIFYYGTENEEAIQAGREVSEG